MAFGVKVKLGVEVVGATKLRSQIQEAVEKATQSKPVKIRHLSVELGRQEAQRISKQLESAIASQSLTIKIEKIDASKAVSDLKNQLTTMLSGLSITGLKDFLGTDGVGDVYDKAAAAADRLAQAQGNAQRKTEEAAASLRTLKTLESTLGSIFKSTFSVEDAAEMEGLLQKYRELMAAIEAAKNKQGGEQSSEVIRLTSEVAILKQKVAARLESEKAARKEASAAQAVNMTEKQAATLATQTIQLRQKINTWVENNSKAYKANKVEIDAILASLQNEGTVSATSLAQIKQQFEAINASARESGITGKSFFDILKVGWAKFGGWSLVTKSMMIAVNGVKSMIHYVTSLDAAMTELKKVTDLTAQSYSSFSNAAAQTAKRVGASIADTINATADFARLGYDINDAASLAEAALIYKNVGDGISDIGVATESLISTLKAFGIEASNAMSVVDMFNEVGNNFAISSSGIGEALQRSASALAAAGNSIEQSIGLVTGMNAVVQNPESVGTALKTLTMYLRAAKTEAEDAGIETDGMADSVSQLRDQILSLAGVDIMLDEDTFKSTYQIIKEISDVWDNLTDVSQSNVLNLLGGKRNANVLASLITNFDDAESAMKSAMNSLGSATTENEKYLDSINGKMAVLKASFEELSSHVVNSAIVKVILDIANGILEAANALAKVHALLPAITTAALTIRGLINANKASKAAGTISSIFLRASNMESTDATGAGDLAVGGAISAISGLTKAQRELALQQVETAISSSTMSEALKQQVRDAISATTANASLAGSGKKLKAVAAGLKGSFVSFSGALLALQAVISVIRFAIDKHNQKVQEAIDKAHELANAYSDAQKSYSSNVKTLKSLEAEFNTLSAGVDENGNNVGLTATEYERYLSIIDQIVNISPDIVSGYDAQGRALLDYKSALSLAIEEQEKFIEAQRDTYLSSGTEIFEGNTEDYKNWAKKLKEQAKKLDDIEYVTLGESLTGWGKEWKQSRAWTTAIRKARIGDLEGTEYYKAIYERSDALLTMLKNSNAFSVDELKDIQSTIQGLSSAYTQLGLIEAEQVDYLMAYVEQEGRLADIPMAARDELQKGLTSINDPLKSYAYNTANAVKYTQQFADVFSTDGAKKLTEMAEGLADGTTKTDDYNAAVKEFGATLDGLGYGDVADMAISYFDSLSVRVQQGTEELESYTASVINLSDALSALSKGYSILSKAQEDMENGGSLSFDTISSIASMLEEGEKITDYLAYENGLIKLNTEAWEARSKAQMDNKIDDTQRQIDNLAGENRALADKGQLSEEEQATFDLNEKQIAQLQEELSLYQAIRDEAASGSSDPMNLSEMISNLETVGNKAKGLLTTLKQLDNGTTLSVGEMANLSLQYEELLGVSPDYDLTTLEGQTAAIEDVIAAYEAEYDAIIAAQIAELEAAKEREGITDEEIAAIDARIAHLQIFEDLGFKGIFGTEEAEKATERYEGLSDAISDVTDAANMLAAIQKGDDYMSTFQKVIDFLNENEDFSLDDFFNADGSFKDLTPEMIDRVFNSFLEGAEELNGWTPEFGEAFKEQFMLIVDGEAEVESTIDNLKSALSSVSDVGDFLTQVSSGDATVLEQIQSALALAETLADAQGNPADWTQWINEISADGSVIAWNEEALRALSDAQVDAAFSAAGLTDKYPGLIQQIKDSAYAATQAEGAANRVTEAYKKMSDANSARQDYGGYTQITYDDYQSLIETDKRYSEAIEYQNGVMVLNGAKHDEITSKILQETRATAQHEKQMILMSEEYQNLRSLMEKGLLTDTKDQQRLLDLETQIRGYDVLANEIDNATSAYYRWLNRKGDDGMDRYSQALEAFELIDSTLNDKESEYYGRIGREEFGLGVDFILGKNVEVNTPEFDRAMEIAQRYLTDGAEGATNFYDDLMSSGLIDGTTHALDSSIAEIAQSLGISEELVRTMIDRLNEYQDEAHQIEVTKPEVETTETESALEEVITSLESANEYIKSISDTPLKIEIQDEENTKAELTSFDELLQSIQENLSAVLQNPASFNLEDLSVATQNILDYLQRIQKSIESLNSAGVSIEGGESESTLAALSSSAEALFTSFTAISNILKSIIQSRDDINAKGVNITTGKTSSFLGTVSGKLSSIIDQLARIKANGNISVKINEVTTKTTKTSGVSRLIGRANVSGNAAARGTAMASGGKTLVGELGMETVVDPATNTWYTVGEKGAEFVRLPKNAIVFNHKQTEELFGTGQTDNRGEAFAIGGVKGALLGIVAGLTSSSKKASDSAKGSAGLARPSSSTSSSSGKNSKSSSSKSSSGKNSSSSSNEKSKLEELRDLYEDLNNQTEHLIAHQEFLYRQAEKGLDYSGMDKSLQAQAELYKKMMADSQKAVSEMIANGAKDTDEELQAMEEAYWSAYDSLYDTLNKINDLYVDALNDKIDGIQKAFNNLQTAADEFNSYGGITVDSFQALLENGVQYLSLLENQNGQYVINTGGIQKLIAAQKEQLAVESAVSYLKQLQTALADNESNAVANLVNLTNQLSATTWDAVYAQAALLRGSLSEEQYAQVIANIDALKAISDSVITDLTKINQAGSSQKDLAKDQQDALEKILDLTEDLIKAEAEDKISAIEDEIDAYKEIINLKKESLKASKDENDYAKNVAEKTKEIASLQVRIDQLKLDDSREARAERARLEEQLSDLQGELGDLQGDRAYDLQTDALDKAADDYEEARQKEIDAIENSISSAEKLYQAALARLESGWDNLYQELIDWNTEMGSSLNSEITENWQKAAEAVKQYGSYAAAVAAVKSAQETGTNGSNSGSSSSSTIVAEGTPTVIPAKSEASTTTPPASPEPDTPSEPEPAPTPVKKVKVVRGRWNVRTGPSTKNKVLGVVGEGTTLDYRGNTSGKWYAVTYKGKAAWINNGGSKLIEELPKYHVGGVAGDKATAKDNEVLSVLEEGEMILTDKMKKAAYTLIDFKDYLEQKLGSKIGAISSPLPQVPAFAGSGAFSRTGVDVGQVEFSPNIRVEINHSGTMNEKEARQYGKTIAETASNELYEGFRKRGIGKIFGTKPKQ